MDEKMQEGLNTEEEVKEELSEELSAEERIQEGLTYLHFKGNAYTVITFAKDADDLSRQLVIYKNITTGEVYAREFNEFASKVDKEKYPDVTQEYRFELVPPRM